jgi:hypothetical protein
MTKQILGLVLSIGLFALASSASSPQQTGITVQFIARGMEPKAAELIKGEKHDFSVGHIFMIISIQTPHGPKEEAFGFYPSTGGRGQIKGPGMLRSEFRCGKNDDCDPSHSDVIKRFSESKESVTIPISIDQRHLLMVELNKWDQKGFDLTKQNCIDFVDALVKVLGYPTPERSRLQQPAQYLDKLRIKVEQEQARRDADEQQRRTREQAQRDADERERKAQEEAARKAEADQIPKGWVKCGCPTVHASYGKYFRGVLYHRPDLVCPR